MPVTQCVGKPLASRGAIIGVALAAILFTVEARAAVLRVNEASTAAHPDGLAWETAFPVLQPAVDAAASGDEVWVAAGTYTGTGDQVVSLKDGMTLYGGFSGTEDSRDRRDGTANLTVIDGQGVRRCVTASATSVVDGFTLQHGLANFGGGMSSGTAVNCIFRENVAAGQFAGMGGGKDGGTAINCMFIENIAGGANGITATNCVFFGNSGSGLTSSDAINCTMAGNIGYGMSSGTAVNCIIWGNMPEETVYVNASYSCLSVPTEGTGNIVADPRYVNFAAGDLRLRAASPCMDAATASGAPATDLALRVRPNGAAPDMGAYEFYAGDDSAAVDAGVLRVNGASTAANPDGLTWETAFPTLQAAADHSGYGGEIWVAGGTYVSESGQVVKLLPATSVYGGFAGTESDREQRDWAANPTTLDGQGARQCVSGNASSTVDGFTLQNGAADHGAGAMCGWTANCIYAGNQAGRNGGGFYGAVAAKCTFSKNTAEAAGGGMYGIEADDCTFTENTSLGFHTGMGGGMSGNRANNCVFQKNVSWLGGGTAGCAATHCTFSENESRTTSAMSSVIGGYGGAMYYGSATNCTFTGNVAAPLVMERDLSGGNGGNGGAVAKVTATNCVFSGNTAFCGGAAFEGAAANCTFFGNTASAQDSAGMHGGTAVNCILWGNSPEETVSAAVSHSCLGTAAVGEGNIVADPLFVNAAEGDLRLRLDSPCINTGASDGAPAADILGTARPQGPACDMGAYEYPYVAVPDLAGLALDAAGQALAAVPLQIGEVTEEYSLTAPEGQVLRQAPEAETQVPQGSAVNLVVSNGPKPVQVPDLVGQAQAAAEAILNDAGLALGTVALQYSVTVPAGMVISQTPGAGTQAFEGSRVDLAISRGGIAVPDVTGQMREAAVATITGTQLAVGTVTEQYSPGVPTGSVISQTPAAGTPVLPGASVDLVISRGVQPSAVPGVVGQTQAQAEQSAAEAGLIVSAMTQAYSDTIPAGIVISQSPAAGTELPPGSGISIVISLGAMPVVEGEGEPPLDIDSARQQLSEAFQQADMNGDGRLSFGEAAAAVPGLTQAVFNALDADGDGQLSPEESGVRFESGCTGCRGTTAKSLVGTLATLFGVLGLTVSAGTGSR